MRRTGSAGRRTRQSRSKPRSATTAPPCPLDRVNRQFQAANAECHCGSLTSRMSRRGPALSTSPSSSTRTPGSIVGWRVARTAHASCVLDALSKRCMINTPGQRGGLVHHSDRGSQGEFKRSSQHLERRRWSMRRPTKAAVRNGLDEPPMPSPGRPPVAGARSAESVLASDRRLACASDDAASKPVCRSQ